MNEFLNKLGVTISTTHEQNLNLIQKLFETARPSAVFSEPLHAGDYTVITAAEVMAGGGVGYGAGGGTGPSMADLDLEEAEASDEIPVEDVAEGDEGTGEGYGVGGGGGGYTIARPVAAITIGPDGVTVEPIVDATKVAIALFTTIGAMALMFARMSKLSQE